MKSLTDKSLDLIQELLDIHWHQDEWFVAMDTALQGVDAKEAAWKPPGTVNTIWQTVNHLIYCNEDVVHRLRGTVNNAPAEDNDATFGSAGDPEDEEGWANTRAHFERVMGDLQAAVAEINEGKLAMPVLRSGSVPRLLGNIMMHDAYHLGQIVLVRKLHNSWPGFNWG